MLEHSVEDEKQLAHAGHQCHLLGFAGRQQSLIEFPHHWVAACGDKSTHVQCRSDVGSPTPDTTTATEGARVTVEGRDAYQGRESLVRERA